MVELNKEDVRKLEIELYKEYRKRLKPVSKKDIKDLQKRIHKFLSKGECGSILFSRIDENLKHNLEFACVRANKRLLKEIFKDYLEIESIKDAFNEIDNDNKKKAENEKVIFRGMVR